ncbi:MAG: DUF4031 domain-containing protein [Pseudonocardiaceae bacterium]
MTVYVDDIRIPATVGPYTSRWSHLFTDSEDLTELHELAHSIGLRRSWFQNKAPGAHYDVTDRLRHRAIHAGARPISWRDIHSVWPNRRTQRNDNHP